MDFLSEEHGVGHRSGDDGVRIGDRLQVIPSHACATVNLFDMAYGVRGDRVERELRITGQAGSADPGRGALCRAAPGRCDARH